MTLDEARPGQKCSIVDMFAEGVLGQRLLDMGFVQGTQIEVVRNAPLVDPVEIRMKGYLLTLRHNEARFVEVVLS
ncbi:MAG: ferrous iron transport protein A [Candidatus Omnitrophica bacterium]|nr:ferrous iron transport protein A [Candidatus Omnitrophota bacterium]